MIGQKQGGQQAGNWVRGNRRAVTAHLPFLQADFFTRISSQAQSRGDLLDVVQVHVMLATFGYFRTLPHEEQAQLVNSPRFRLPLQAFFPQRRFVLHFNLEFSLLQENLLAASDSLTEEIKTGKNNILLRNSKSEKAERGTQLNPVGRPGLGVVTHSLAEFPQFAQGVLAGTTLNDFAG